MPRSMMARSVTLQPERLFYLLSDAMHEVLARKGVVWTPQTKLAEIDGWNSNKTVTVMLAMERRLGRSLRTDELDNVATVNDLVLLASIPDIGRTALDPTRGRSHQTSMFARFESLGDSCEFGVVQQEFGIMQPHLLRFASFLGGPAEQLARLIAALRDDFSSIADRDFLDLQIPDQEWDGGEKEYRFVNSCYGWQIHTGLMVGAYDMNAAKIRLKDFPESLAFLRDKQLRELRLGRKIWIWKSAQPSPQQDVEALLDVLQIHGRNTLLWVLRADAAHPPGTIVRMRDNFLKGYIWKSDAEWAGDWSDSGAWLKLIRAVDEKIPSSNVVEVRSPSQCAPLDKVSPRDKGSYRTALEMLNDVVSRHVEDPSLELTPAMVPADVLG
jgi:acyl carrier protein